MTLDQHHQARVTNALAAVQARAKEAAEAGDIITCRRALTAAWFAIHEAQDTLNTAERETRDAALAKLEHAA